MSRITELINLVKIYNLCNYCDHCTGGECLASNVNCKEEIEKQIVAEIRSDAIDEFAKGSKLLFRKWFECGTMDLTEINTLAEQLKDQKK